MQRESPDDFTRFVHQLLKSSEYEQSMVLIRRSQESQFVTILQCWTFKMVSIAIPSGIPADIYFVVERIHIYQQ